MTIDDGENHEPVPAGRPAGTAQSAAEMVANRLRKRFRHLRKWARRTGVSCFRVYDRDIPEAPLIVDWYDGDAVAWIYQRHRDETTEQADEWTIAVHRSIATALEIGPEHLFLKERRRQQGQQYTRVATAQHIRMVKEGALTFEVNLSDYLDTGLFLDHRSTRALVGERVRDRHFLNLFAYTGSFSCHAIAGGARTTTTVDLSQTYCDWTERNFRHNGASRSDQHRIVREDSFQFLEEAAQARPRYDVIVCDPPTFSNSKRMQKGSFSVDRDYPELIGACLRVLAPAGELVFSTNSTSFRLEPKALPPGTTPEEITHRTVPEDFKGRRPHRCWIFKKT